MFTDNSGWCKAWTENSTADERRKIYDALSNVTKQEGSEMQLVVRHVKAHATGDSRKRMKDKVEINTEGKKQTNLQTWEHMWRKQVERNDVRVILKQNVRTFSKSLTDAMHFDADGGELKENAVT